MAASNSKYDRGWRWCGWCEEWQKPQENGRCPECHRKLRIHPRNDRKKYVNRVARIE